MSVNYSRQFLSAAFFIAMTTLITFSANAMNVLPNLTCTGMNGDNFVTIERFGDGFKYTETAPYGGHVSELELSAKRALAGANTTAFVGAVTKPITDDGESRTYSLWYENTALVGTQNGAIQFTISGTTDALIPLTCEATL